MQFGAESLANPVKLDFAKGKMIGDIQPGPVPVRTTTHGATADMGETAEFEKLNMLEARLATALDRIASGLAKAQSAAALDDPGVTSAAFEDAMIRAQTAEARIVELEAQLAEAARSGGADALESLTRERDAARADLRALEAARQSEREAATSTLATLEGELARLQSALTLAQSQPRPDPALAQEHAALQDRIAELEARLAEVEAEAPPAELLESLTEDRDRALADLRALEAARQSEREAATGTLAKLEGEVARLQAALSAAQDEARPDPSLLEARDALQQQVAMLETQLAQAVADRDDATRAAEAALAQADAAPAQDEATLAALRAEITELQAINGRLVKNINRLRGENATDPGVLNKTLLVELDALRALRASEAAELARILAEMDKAAEGEGADA